MKLAIRLACIFGVGFLIFEAALQVRPFLSFVAGSGLCLFALGVAFLASLIKGFFTWRKSTRHWYVPSAVSAIFVLAFPLGATIGRVISDSEFKRRQPEYEQVIADIKSGVIKCGTNLDSITPKTMPANALDIKAAVFPDGAVLVQALVGSGFPLIHTGYFFNGSGQNPQCQEQFKDLKRKFALRPIDGHWYHFSD